MFYLLQWRLWLGLGLLLIVASLYPIGYIRGESHGKAVERVASAKATAAANLEARQIEQHRETVLGVAVKSAAARAVGNRSDAAHSGDALIGLRDAIHARRVAEGSLAAANQRADSLGELFIEGVSAYRELAETCDRHVNDVRMLLDAWPR